MVFLTQFNAMLRDFTKLKKKNQSQLLDNVYWQISQWDEMPDSSHVFKIFEKHSRKSVLLENEPLFLKNSLTPLGFCQ